MHLVVITFSTLILILETIITEAKRDNIKVNLKEM